MLLLMFLFSGVGAFAAEETAKVDLNDVEVPAFTEVFTNLPEDWSLFKDRVVAPQNRTVVYSVLASTAFFVAYDYELVVEGKKLFDQSQQSKDIMWAGVSIGDGYFQFGMAGTFAAWGYMTDNKRLLRTAHQITEVILSTGAVVQLMKHFTGRESPFKASERSGRWEPFPEQVRYYKDVQKYDAVPSGHLATAYATFRVIMKNYPEKKWIPWVGYPVVTWVAVGLTGTELHWVSDYPIAILLGHWFADIVTDRNNKQAMWEPEVGSVWYRPIVSVGPSHVGVPIVNLGWRM